MVDESAGSTTADPIGNGLDIASLLKGLGGAGATGVATGGLGFLAAIPSLWKMGAGLIQGLRANSLSGPRPTYAPPQYSIPPEVQQYLNKTQNRMIDPTLPGSRLTEDRLGAATSNAAEGVMQSGKSSGDVLNTISKVYGNQMDAENNLGVEGAKNYQGLVQKKDSDVNTALEYSAGYKDKKYAEDLGRYKEMFQINNLDPFMQSSAASSALGNASGRNIYGGVNDLSSLATLMAILKKTRGTNTETGSTTGGGGFPSTLGA